MKENKQSVKEYRERKKAQGFIRFERLIKPEWKNRINKFIDRLK